MVADGAQECSVEVANANGQAFQVLVDHHFDSASATGGALRLSHSLWDISHALTVLELFVSEDLPSLVEECFDSRLRPSPETQEWLIRFVARMERRFHLPSPLPFCKSSCLSFLEEDCSWMLTHVWLEWRHVLTPPAWAFSDKAAHATWQAGCARKLALADQEKDTLRFCAEILASCEQSPDQALLIRALIDEVRTDANRSQTAWWTANCCPPACSPWC